MMIHPHTVLDDVYKKGHDEGDRTWERCRDAGRSVKNSPYRREPGAYSAAESAYRRVARVCHPLPAWRRDQSARDFSQRR